MPNRSGLVPGAIKHRWNFAIMPQDCHGGWGKPINQG
jgi:hypothetical protein